MASKPASKDKPKRFPLPSRFNAAMSEAAYARLRQLNGEYGLGNNYLLTVLLEHLDEYADAEALDRVFQNFIAEYGAPAPATMKSGKKKPPATATDATSDEGTSKP